MRTRVRDAAVYRGHVRREAWREWRRVNKGPRRVARSVFRKNFA